VKSTVLGVALIVSVMWQLKAVADEPFRALDEEVVKILKMVYPEAVLERDGHQNVFACNMREFTVCKRNKTGDWQRPTQEKGPDRGGIAIRFYVKKGRWSGAMLVSPRGVTTTTEDLPVFRTTTFVGNSKDGNWHIWAQIATPKTDAPVEVANRLAEAFRNWEKYK